MSTTQAPAAGENPRSLAAVLFDLGGNFVTPQPDCVLWMSDNDRGYGKVRIDGVNKRVHRVVWERLNGPIPDNLTVDHLCRVRSCVNPAHMELVSAEENIRRMAAARARATHCKRGHEFTPSNTYLRTDGRRRCRTCMDAYESARRQRRSAA